jgi:DNA-directed RNA polymerase subunit RPC12/RpoP
MVQLECGYCGADVETDDEDDGENLVCPECGEVLF